MPPATRQLYRPMQRALFALGCVCAALGIFGLVVPGFPGTVFLIVAAWAFSRSSERMHVWLYKHPRFGRTLRDWHTHRVIPLRAKAFALTAMTGSFALFAVAGPDNVYIVAVTASIMAGVALWIATRPQRIPADG
jgi:uncharacterized membrane protein YbaN (DUF454 family)